jgi:hypothetical protein
MTCVKNVYRLNDSKYEIVRMIRERNSVRSRSTVYNVRYYPPELSPLDLHTSCIPQYPS